MIKIIVKIKKSLKNILYRKYYNNILKTLKNTNSISRVIVFLVPEHNNIGDQAIALSQKSFIKESIPNIEYIEISIDSYITNRRNIESMINKNDIILIHGGGYFGTLYRELHEYVNEIINTYINNKIVILPQTIYYDSIIEEDFNVMNSHNNLVLFLRDKNSYNLIKDKVKSHIKFYYVPDTVCSYEYLSVQEREGILLCLRSDIEGIIDKTTIIEKLKKNGINFKCTDTINSRSVLIKDRDFVVKSKMNEFAESTLVITDRLHGMIFCAITKTPCIAFNNINGKVGLVYEWLRENNYIRVLSNDDNLIKDIEELQSIDTSSIIYNNTIILENLQIIIDEITTNQVRKA